MYANRNKQEVECQTILQCSPHILGRDELATVQSDAACQTLVSCDPKTSNSELGPLLEYFDPEEIQRDALSQLYLPRVRKLKFILPEWHIDSMQVSREQLRRAKDNDDDDDDTTDEGNAEGSAPSAACEEFQTLGKERMQGSQQPQQQEEEITDVPNENISAYTGPKSASEELIVLDKEKETEQSIKDASKESVRNSADQDGLQIQSILKHYRDDETMRRKRRRQKNADANCQTDLMVAPHILLPFETAVVSCELSVQTSVTCHPTCSISDILPKLRSYVVHEGRHAEPTSGDNKNNASVLDLLKELINEVENSHRHMFDSGYRPPVVPRQLTESRHEPGKEKFVKFTDDRSVKVRQEKPKPPEDVKYSGVKQEKSEPPEDVKYSGVKQEKREDPLIKQEKPEPPGDVKYPLAKQEKLEDLLIKQEKPEPPGDVKYSGVKQEKREPPGNVKYPLVKQEPLDVVTDLSITQENPEPPDDVKYSGVRQEPELFDGVPIEWENVAIKVEPDDIDEMPVSRMDYSDINSDSDNQPIIKEKISIKGDLDENGSDLQVTGPYAQSNIIASYDLTEDDSSETLPDEVKQIISHLIDNVLGISKPDTQTSRPASNYNINIFVNNFISPSTDANQRLIDTAFQLNVLQGNQMQPDVKSSKQITDENVHVHQVISAGTPSHADIQNVKRLSALDLVITCTTVLNGHSERPQQSTVNLTKQLRKSNEDRIDLNQDKSKEQLPCASTQKWQLIKTRPCGSAEICQNSDYVLIVQLGSSESESLNDSLIEIQCPSQPCRPIECVQRNTSNIHDSMCSDSESLVSLKEIKYPATPSQENLTYSANVCDNVGLQNCPARNVCFISQISATDNSSHRENVQSSSITENLDHLCPCKCYVQDPSQEMLPSTDSKINVEKPIAAQTIVSTTITITSNASKPKVISRQISTGTSPTIQAKVSKHVSFHKNDIEGSDYLGACPCRRFEQNKQKSEEQSSSPNNMHVSFHKNDIEGSDQLARADDLLTKQSKQKSKEQISSPNMLCEGNTVENYVEPYMEELADEYEFPFLDDKVDTLFPEEKEDNLVYNNCCSECYIETYTLVGYAAEGNLKNQILFAPSKSIPQLEKNDLGRCDSKPEIPWNVVHLQPNIKISYVDKEKSEIDLNNPEKIQKKPPRKLLIPTIKSMLFNQTCVNNEPYAKKLAKEFSVEERTAGNEIEWDKIILSRPAKIRNADIPKSNKEANEVMSSKSLPCICKFGCVIPVRVHRNIDLLCRNRAPLENEIACIPHGDSTSTIVILPPRSRHFISTKFPVAPETGASLTKAKNDRVEEPLKDVTFVDSKRNNSKKKRNLVPSKSESSLQCGKCTSVTSTKSSIPKLEIPVEPVMKKSKTPKFRINLKISKSQDSNKSSTPRSLSPVPTKEEINESKLYCDPCNIPLEVKSSVSTASLKAKPDRVFMAMSACETEFKPIKQALNNVQEKLRNLNMPELDCIFNKEPAYTNTLPTDDKEKYNISVGGYKLDQSNQGSFKYNGMNSNGMNNQYNTFSGIGCSNVSPTLRYSHTSNTYPSHTSMPYHQSTESYHSYIPPNISTYPRQHQNYYSLPDSEWSVTNCGNNIDFSSPAENIASKYSFRNFDQDDYDEEFRTNAYIPDYIPSQYSVYNSGKQERKRKDRPKDKECSFDHNSNSEFRNSRNVPDSCPYFYDDYESSYNYRKNYGNSDKHSHGSLKYKNSCDCKKPRKSSSRIKSNKKNQTRRSKTNVETTDSQCVFFDVIKSLFFPPDKKHNKKNTPRLTSKDIENLRVHMQFHSKKDKHKHN